MSIRNTGERVRVFIGSEARTEIARKVLECSILRRTEMQVDFVPMIGPHWEYSTNGIKCGTGFSLRRWMIPEYCNWQGRAIYLDADQLCLADIWDLWTKPEQHPTKIRQAIWCTYQSPKGENRRQPETSVMVIDCEAAKSHWSFRISDVLFYLRANTSRKAYLDFQHCSHFDPRPQRFDGAWNHMDTYIAPKFTGATKLVHYTSVPSSPWRNPDHPFAEVWKKELMVALRMKLIKKEEFETALKNWVPEGRDINGLHPDYAGMVEIIERSTI